jgi:hypothetical protein
MGCSASTEARSETYSPSSAAKAAARRNQIVPLDDTRAVRSIFPLAGDDPRAPAPRLASHRESRATVSIGSSSRWSSREKSGGRSGVGVVQSVLKLKTETRTNQYKLVSGKPIGKGFQSKVRRAIMSFENHHRCTASKSPAASQVYLVEDTNSKSRERFAMKVLDMKRANKMADKATDSNIMGDDGAFSFSRCPSLSRSFARCLPLSLHTSVDRVRQLLNTVARDR